MFILKWCPFCIGITVALIKWNGISGMESICNFFNQLGAVFEQIWTAISPPEPLVPFVYDPVVPSCAANFSELTSLIRLTEYSIDALILNMVV